VKYGKIAKIFKEMFNRLLFLIPSKSKK